MERVVGPVRPAWLSHRGSLIVGALVLLTWTTPCLSAPADPSAASSFGLQLGKVTAKRGKELEINRKVYRLAANVVIKDPGGNVISEGVIMPGVDVMFRAQRERIDELIVYRKIN